MGPGGGAEKARQTFARCTRQAVLLSSAAGKVLMATHTPPAAQHLPTSLARGGGSAGFLREVDVGCVCV